MNKTELRSLIAESINEVREEQNAYKILRESFEHDVNQLHEHRLVCESLVDRGLLTESQVDEGFFDTIKHFGKNTVNSVVGAWKKAKAQGDKDAIARLEKKLAQMKAATKSGGAKTKSGSKKISGGTKKPVTKKSSRVKAAQNVGAAILKNTDPKTAQTLTKAKPEQVAKALKNPKVKRQAAKIAKAVSKEKGAGLLEKFGSWMKKNPVKGGLAIAAIAAVTTALTGGVAGPAVAATVGHMLHAGAYGGAIAGTIGGATALAQGKGVKAAGKEFLRRGAQGAAVAAGGSLLGQALGGLGGGSVPQDNRVVSRDADDFDINSDKPSYTGGGVGDDVSSSEDDELASIQAADATPAPEDDELNSPQSVGSGETDYDQKYAQDMKTAADDAEGMDDAGAAATSPEIGGSDQDGVPPGQNEPEDGDNPYGDTPPTGDTDKAFVRRPGSDNPNDMVPNAQASSANADAPMSDAEARARLKNYGKSIGMSDDDAEMYLGGGGAQPSAATEPVQAQPDQADDNDIYERPGRSNLRYADDADNRYDTPGKGRIDKKFRR